ncbi:MAG: response regulator, partial [Crocinitomicaceae bacterium]
MKKILIIDDERSIRRALGEILQFEGYEVAEAEDGNQGIEVCKNEAFDLVFCDIKMPGKDGMEVLAEIHPLFPELPIVMISGHGTIETAVEAIKKGAFDFIEKPLDLNRILVTIRNANERVSLVEQTTMQKTT